MNMSASKFSFTVHVQEAAFWPEKTEAFENGPLFRRTVMRRMKASVGNLELQSKTKVDNSDLFSLALDESCNCR